MELLNEIFSQFNAVLWGPPLILLLLGTHLWMTVRTRGVQRWVFKGIKLSVTPDKTEGGYQSVRGADDSAGVHDRHRQHHRRGDRNRFRRAGRSAVDMADRVVRHRH